MYFNYRPAYLPIRTTSCWDQSSRSLNGWLGPHFPFPFPRCYGVCHHFVGLLEEVHRPAKYTKPIGLQMAVQVFPGIPFFENMEFIFVLHAPAKGAAQASLLCPYGADQGSDRLRQLHALLRKNLHSYDDQYHTDGTCKWPANNLGRKGNWNNV